MFEKQQKESSNIDKYKHAYWNTIRNQFSLLVSYDFAYVHFLNFGEWKMSFLNIDPFTYGKYIEQNFRFLEDLFVLRCEMYTKSFSMVSSKHRSLHFHFWAFFNLLRTLNMLLKCWAWPKSCYFYKYMCVCVCVNVVFFVG